MGGWAQEQAPRGSGQSTEPDRVPEAFGQYSWARGVILGDGLVQGQELDSMSLEGFFQFSLFCNYAEMHF